MPVSLAFLTFFKFFSQKRTSLPSHHHPNLFSFLRLPGFYAAWKSHNINECESVSGKQPLLLEPQTHVAATTTKKPKPQVLSDTPPNVVAVLCLAQPKLPWNTAPLFPPVLTIKEVILSAGRAFPWHREMHWAAVLAFEWGFWRRPGSLADGTG